MVCAPSPASPIAWWSRRPVRLRQATGRAAASRGFVGSYCSCSFSIRLMARVNKGIGGRQRPLGELIEVLAKQGAQGDPALVAFAVAGMGERKADHESGTGG